MPRKGTENTPSDVNSDSADFTFVHWRPNEQGRNNFNLRSQTNTNGGSSAQDGGEHRDSRCSDGPSGNVVSVVGSSLSTHSPPSIPTLSLLANATASAASSGGQRDLGTSFSFSTSLSSGKSNTQKKAPSSSGKASTSSSRSTKRRRADDDEDVVGIAGTSEPVQNNAPIRGRPRTTNPSAKRRRVKPAAVSSQPGAEAEAMIQMASRSSVVVAPPTRRDTRSGPRAENPYPVIPPSLLPPPSQPKVVDGGSSPSTTQVESASNTRPRRAENPYPDPLTFLPPTGSRSVDSGSSVLGRPFSPSATSGAVIPTAAVGTVPPAISLPDPSPQLANVAVDTTSMATTSSPNPGPFVPVDLRRLLLENFPIFAPMALTPMMSGVDPEVDLDVAHPLPHELKVQHQRPRFERPQLPSATPQPNPDLQQSSLPFASGHQNATQTPATNVVEHASPVPGTPPLHATYPPDDDLAVLFAALNDWYNRLPLRTTQSPLSGNDPTPTQEGTGNHSATINTSQLSLPTMTNATVARQGTQSQVPPPVVSKPQDSEDSFGVAYHEHHTHNLPK
ncbi:hypothetical protein ONZ45_g15648 [Pleurotus djamor]|nr:hypothetical protein ONZ45_g15648 [Pleurotus djamor]